MQSYASAERKPPAPFRGRRNLLQAEHTGVKRNARIDVRYVKRDVVDRDRRTALSAQNDGESDEEKRDDGAEAAAWNAAFEAFCRDRSNLTRAGYASPSDVNFQQVATDRGTRPRRILRSQSKQLYA